MNLHHLYFDNAIKYFFLEKEPITCLADARHKGYKISLF